MATPPPPPPPGNRRSHVTTSPSSVPETRKSTEQVWKDIKLAPLCNGSSSSTTNTTLTLRNTLLHDFLSGPFTEHSSSAFASVSDSVQPTPLLNLNLTSTTDSSVFHTECHHHHHHHSFLSDTLKSSTAVTLLCPPSSSSNTNKKRVRREHSCGGSSDLQRYQRIMKNRESALRSRARKQAYKTALEIKLARLTEENSMLKRQVEELRLCLTSSAKPTNKMRTLHRTSTSPF